jgi:hypothetical protein
MRDDISDGSPGSAGVSFFIDKRSDVRCVAISISRDVGVLYEVSGLDNGSASIGIGV